MKKEKIIVPDSTAEDLVKEYNLDGVVLLVAKKDLGTAALVKVKNEVGVVIRLVEMMDDTKQKLVLGAAPKALGQILANIEKRGKKVSKKASPKRK